MTLSILRQLNTQTEPYHRMNQKGSHLKLIIKMCKIAEYRNIGISEYRNRGLEIRNFNVPVTSSRRHVMFPVLSVYLDLVYLVYLVYRRYLVYE